MLVTSFLAMGSECNPHHFAEVSAKVSCPGKGKSDLCRGFFLLFTVAILAVLCGGCCEETEMGNKGMPPWHMWGDTQTLDVQSVAAFTGNQPFATQQMVRINYKRPETWRWWFTATIAGGNTNAGATLVVVYKAQFGVGRAMTTVNLGRFEFTWAAAPVPIGAQKFTNNVNGPVPIDGGTLPNVINTFVAQDIQLVVEAQLLSATAADQVQVIVDAFFAPEGHVRPDWFQGNAAPDAKFPGDETGGR